MAGQSEDHDSSTDKRTERDNEQARRDLAEVDPGGELEQPKNDKTEEQGDPTRGQR